MSSAVSRVELSQFPFFASAKKIELQKIDHLECREPTVIENSTIEKVTSTSHLFFRGCILGDVVTSGHIICIGDGVVKSLKAGGNVHISRNQIKFDVSAGGEIFHTVAFPLEHVIYSSLETPELKVGKNAKTITLEGKCHISGNVIFSDAQASPEDRKVILKPGARLDGSVIGGTLVIETSEGVH